MWDKLENEDQDLALLIAGLKQASVIAVADGSYDRKKAPEVSGAGWVLCCTRSWRMLRGNFYKVSPTASSYRGKLLGLAALHYLLGYLQEYY